MLTTKELATILQSYNMNSQKYGPTIYKKKNEIGLCLEIKDSIFGFLTRYFLFQEKNEAENFLKKQIWYKKNNKKYPIILELDRYDIPNPIIHYKYNNKDLTLEEMLNFNNIIKENKEENQKKQRKKIYIEHLTGLINYLINLRKEKEKIKKDKNNLKKLENDLKYELLEKLTLYYGKDKTITKKAVSLDIIQDNHIDDLEEKRSKLETIEEEELKKELTNIISIIKEEELDEKNLINIYSNIVYNYNISILKKQIEFVESKIEAEKNFNLKGSKIHNIDEELRSFLKTNIAPKKIEEYIAENKEIINNKFNQITNDLEAYPTLCNINIELPEIKEQEQYNEKSIIKELEEQFDTLDNKVKAELILYNSIFKNICNYIINNHYPDIETIKKDNDLNSLYNELEEIVFNENNSHYLNTYFKYLNFKDLNSYIESIIEICKTIENTTFELKNPLKVFYIEENNLYKKMTLNPIFCNNKKTYIVQLNNIPIIYIPDKIIIEEENKEFNTISCKNIYIKKNIIDNFNTLTLNKYNKKQEKENNIIITTDLILDKKIIFNIGNIGE